MSEGGIFLTIWLTSIVISYFLFRECHKMEPEVSDPPMILIFLVPILNIFFFLVVLLNLKDVDFSEVLDKLFFIKR